MTNVMDYLRKAFPALMPVVAGTGFILLVWLDQHLFRKGTISVRGAIWLELIYFVFFCGVLLGSVGNFFINFGRRPAWWSLLILLGLSLGIYLFAIGIGKGAAIVYTT